MRLTPNSPLTTHHYSLLTTTHYSLLTTHYSLLTTHYSLLTTHYSLLTTLPQPTAAEIEIIVRRVLSTLNGGAAHSVNPSVQTSNRLMLEDRVVSVQSLKDRLAGVSVLQIPQAAVLTPAARDICRAMKVEVVRGEANPSTNSSVTVVEPSETNRPQRLCVAGSANWMPSIAKQLCPKQANVHASANDDSTAMRSIAEGIRAGHQGGIAIVQAPHAACWQAGRDDRLRPAVVSQWSDLPEVLREVPVNLLILSSKTWNVSSACNVARRFFQHLQNQS
jgi:hypothetical protein